MAEARPTRSPRSLLDRLRSGLSSIRARSALMAAAAVALILAIAVAGVLWQFSRNLRANLDDSLLAQATDRARLIDLGGDPDGLVDLRQAEAFVWIGGVDGTTVAAGGPLLPTESPVPAATTGVATVEVEVVEQYEREVERERMDLRVASAATAETVNGSPMVVVAGTEAEVVTGPVRQLALLFGLGYPPLVIGAGLLGWFLTGRALLPVEAIRRRTSAVGGASLGQRVPVPDTDDEINRLALTMNDMLARLEAHQLAQRQFTADASHELKSPVANLRALLETTDLGDPAWPGLQQRLTGETDRLRDLVDNLLFLASHHDRLADDGDDHRPTVHLDDLLFDEAELVSATGRATVDIGAIEPVEVAGVRADLQRLIRNLVDNAARHAATTVALGCRAEEDRVVVIVDDDGSGIEPSDREQIFERFARLGEARDRDSGGTGLGLAIAARIVADHRGEITVSEAPIGGARFTIDLPRAR